MIGIVGMNMEQVKRFARERNLGREGHDWIAITTKSVRGRQLEAVIFLSSWWRGREDSLDEMYMAIEPCLVS